MTKLGVGLAIIPLPVLFLTANSRSRLKLSNGSKNSWGSNEG
jgi:hypothetical protein